MKSVTEINSEENLTRNMDKLFHEPSHDEAVRIRIFASNSSLTFHPNCIKGTVSQNIEKENQFVTVKQRAKYGSPQYRINRAPTFDSDDEDSNFTKQPAALISPIDDHETISKSKSKQLEANPKAAPPAPGAESNNIFKYCSVSSGSNKAHSSKETELQIIVKPTLEALQVKERDTNKYGLTKDQSTFSPLASTVSSTSSNNEVWRWHVFHTIEPKHVLLFIAFVMLAVETLRNCFY